MKKNNLKLTYIITTALISFTPVTYSSIISFNYEAKVTTDGTSLYDNPNVELGDKLHGTIVIDTDKTYTNGGVYNNRQQHAFSQNASQANFTFDEKNYSSSFNYYVRPYQSGSVNITDTDTVDSIRYSNLNMNNRFSLNASSTSNLFDSHDISNISYITQMENATIGYSNNGYGGQFGATITNFKRSELRELIVSDTPELQDRIDILMDKYNNGELPHVPFAKERIEDVLASISTLNKVKDELGNVQWFFNIVQGKEIPATIANGLGFETKDTIDASITKVQSHFEGLAELVCEGTNNECYVELTSQSPAAMSIDIPWDLMIDGFSFDFNINDFDLDDYLFVDIADDTVFGGYASDFIQGSWINSGVIDLTSYRDIANNLTIGVLTDDANRKLQLKNFDFFGQSDSIQVPEPSSLVILGLGLLGLIRSRSKKV